MTRRFLVSGPFRLDLIDERLWRDGVAQPISSKPFALLRAFMERPQTLLTKEDLIDEGWLGLAVGEYVLTTAIKDLRRALGDDARNPTIIRTVHGRGYRYMLPVEEVDDLPAEDRAATAPRSPSRRGILVGGLAVGGLASAAAAGLAVAYRSRKAPVSDKSIAVLPFEDLSERRDQGWFADGLTEEVLNSLARTPDLRVVSREASGRFRGSDASLREIGRQLGVAHLLEGTVRRAGERLRVGVDLIRARDESRIWSKVYDRKNEDLISIQEDIAFDIARALRTVMEPAKLRAMVETGTRSVEAYEAYLRGVALEQQHLADGDVALTRRAGEAFDQARSLDQGFAAAHWRAAQSWYGNATRLDAGARGELDETVRKREFLKRVDMAVATSRDEVERLKYASGAAAIRLQFQLAYRLMARYLEARPRDVEALDEMTDLAGYVGDRRWVGKAAERLHDISMQDGLPLSRAITASVMALEPAAAMRRAREQLTLRPDNATIQYQAHRAFLAAGRIGEARAMLVRIRASRMKADARALAELRQACAEGRVTDALALRKSIDATGDLAPRWHAAQLLGDTRGAEALLRPYDRPEELSTLMQFMVFPSFDARPFPVLQALLVREGVKRPAPTPAPFACKAA